MTAAGREYLVVIAGLLVGSLACVVLAGSGWATAELTTTLDTTDIQVAGRELVPIAAAVGWLGLAAVVAIHASRRIGRVVIGMLLTAAGLAVSGWAVWRALDLKAAAERAAASGDAVPTVTGTVPAAAIGTALAGALICAAGIATVLRGSRWPALGRAYERPATREAATGAAPSPREAWGALDRGDDPTNLAAQDRVDRAE